MKRKMFILTALAGGALSAQQKTESLAIFPFTGGSAEDGDFIAADLARQPVLRNAFRNNVTPITRSAIQARGLEQRFQRSGLTDPDMIFELGKDLNASHVVSGFITEFEGRKLVLVSILDVESLQQIAGAYQPYGGIEEMRIHLPDIAKRLADAVRQDTSGLPGLSVPPFNFAGLAGNARDQNSAMVLAQILACDLANGNKYAVLPRTDSLKAVMEEHRRQQSGVTDQARAKRLGLGKNAEYVLDGTARRLGSLSMFTADILHIENGKMFAGYESETYANLAEGLEIIPKLAARVNGGGALAGMVLIPAGAFMMGSPESEPKRDDDEGPQHRVTISAFYMGKYVVTQKEWREVMGTNPSAFTGDTLPVENVSWYDAVEYCNRLSLKEGLAPAYTIQKARSDPNNTSEYDYVPWLVTWNRGANGYRLPTEAEWEYACRAGTTTPFNTGNNITTGTANYNGEHPYNREYDEHGLLRGETTAVGSFAANAFGLYDMHGNLWEWCWDWFGEYAGAAQTDPPGPASGAPRVLRGGSWISDAQCVRSACRNSYAPTRRDSCYGFRLVRSLPPDQASGARRFATSLSRSDLARTRGERRQGGGAGTAECAVAGAAGK